MINQLHTAGSFRKSSGVQSVEKFTVHYGTGSVITQKLAFTHYPELHVCTQRTTSLQEHFIRQENNVATTKEWLLHARIHIPQEELSAVQSAG
jgi:hypothetical protein